jgi:hypothetical protein
MTVVLLCVWILLGATRFRRIPPLLNLPICVLPASADRARVVSGAIYASENIPIPPPSTNNSKRTGAIGAPDKQGRIGADGSSGMCGKALVRAERLEQFLHVVGVLFLLGKDLLHRDAGSRIVVAKIADDLVVGFVRVECPTVMTTRFVGEADFFTARQPAVAGCPARRWSAGMWIRQAIPPRARSRRRE